MPAFQHVVVGLDGSRAAIHALRWAADRVDASAIEVVHSGAPDPQIPADVEVHSIHSRDDAPEQALIDVAREVGADTIVIGPHGSGLGRGLGRVARHLLRDAPLPVVVVDGLEPPRSLGLRPPVVACVGYGDPAEAATLWAAEYAQNQHLPLVLLHAIAYRPIFSLDSASDVLASYLGTGVSADWARSELADIVTELGLMHPELEISTHVDCDSVVKAVARAGQNAEVVVLGKRTDEAFFDMIGTPRLRRLVARSRFPTAVVPSH